jgi:type II secretory pathway pseudopilin PulG
MNCSRRHKQTGGFTLAEVLAAMLFLAIVIPVAVGGLRIASHAGEVAARKTVAARIAERVLNEMIVTGQVQNSAAGGTVTEGAVDYRWALSVEPSGLDTLRLATVKVSFTAQDSDHDVNLSTLVAGQ